MITIVLSENIFKWNFHGTVRRGKTLAYNRMKWSLRIEMSWSHTFIVCSSGGEKNRAQRFPFIFSPFTMLGFPDKLKLNNICLISSTRCCILAAVAGAVNMDLIVRFIWLPAIPAISKLWLRKENWNGMIAVTSDETSITLNASETYIILFYCFFRLFRI